MVEVAHCRASPPSFNGGYLPELLIVPHSVVQSLQ
jgi:hypothetical protein